MNGDAVTAVMAILGSPSAKKPYEDLANLYRRVGMSENAEHVEFLIKKRFGGAIADSSDVDEGQRGDAGANSGVAVAP